MAVSDIAKGAASGSALGPWGMAAGAALGVIPTVAGFFAGRAQRKAANRIKPVDPGFVANQGIMDNQRIVNNMYNNYTLPGMAGIQDNLNAGYATALNTSVQGATSSSDVLDAATKLSYNQGQNINALGIQAAQSKEAMLPMVLQSNMEAGNEAVRKNAFDESRYQAQLAEKAALLGAGTQNMFGAADNLATLGGSLLNYKAQPWTRDGSGSAVSQLPSINFRGNKVTG